MRQVGVGDFKTTEKMRRYVNNVLGRNRLSYGPYCKAFEYDFAKMHDCRFGVLSNSGTSSLQVALQAMKELYGWQDGDEVIVPAVTFVATANIVLHNRMKPVLVDVDPDYYEIDMDQVRDAFSFKTRAIIPVHLFGQPCEMSHPMFTELEKAGVRCIEDSCECMYATHRGQKVGSFGQIGVFSTYVAHILTTGVGGIATTNDAALAAKMRSLVNHGRAGVYISIDDDDEPTKEILTKRFHFESIGHSYRITEMEAALACAQLEDLWANIEKRQLNAAYLGARLAHLQDRIQLPQVRPYTSHSYMMFPIVLREGDKWKLIEFLEQRGIETRECLPLTNQPCYKGLFNEDDYPVAKWLNQQGLYLGCHPGLAREDLDYVIEAFYEYFKEN